ARTRGLPSKWILRFPPPHDCCELRSCGSLPGNSTIRSAGKPGSTAFRWSGYKDLARPEIQSRHDTGNPRNEHRIRRYVQVVIGETVDEDRDKGGEGRDSQVAGRRIAASE